MCVGKGTKDYEIQVKRSGSRSGELERGLFNENVLSAIHFWFSCYFPFSHLVREEEKQEEERTGHGRGLDGERKGRKELKGE